MLRRSKRLKVSSDLMILGGFNNGSDSDVNSESDGSEDSETWSQFGDRLLATNTDLPEEEVEDTDIKLDDISIDGDFGSQSELEVERSKGQKVDDYNLNSYLNIDLKSLETLVINVRLEDVQNINSRFWQPIVYINKLPQKDTSIPFLPDIDKSKEPQLLSLSCTICDRKFSSFYFSKIHYQLHVTGLKCINDTCKVKCQDLADLKSHTSFCLLATRCKKETKSRHRISPINCIFTDCSRGFFDDGDFIRHLKSFHGETSQTLNSTVPELFKDKNKTTTAQSTSRLRLSERARNKARIENETEEQRNRRIALGREYRANLTAEQRSRQLAIRSAKQKFQIANETAEERNRRLALARENMANETEERRRQRRALKNARQKSRRANETAEQRTRRLETAREYKARKLGFNETEEQRSIRLAKGREYMARKIRFFETEEQTNRRKALDRERMAKKRREKWLAFDRARSEQQSETGDQGQKFGADVSCESCQTLFSSPITLNTHNKYKHPEIFKNPAYMCELCGRSFKLQIHLDDHKLFTHNSKPLTKVAEQVDQTDHHDHGKAKFNYLCETCGKGFLLISGYNGHIERHSKILALRKEAYEKTVRLENPLKSDEEIQEILTNFWKSAESCVLIAKRESLQETRAVGRLLMIEKIAKKGSQRPDETVEQCLDRLNAEKLEKKLKDRETETEEERLTRRERYRINHNLWKARNKEKYDNYMKAYYSYPKNKNMYFVPDKNSEKYQKLLTYQKAKYAKQTPEKYQKFLASQRERWAKQTPEQKARRLEKMKNYAKNKKRH